MSAQKTFLRRMKVPRVEIICIGTELITGKVNTHVAYLGQKLAEIGLKISREHTVGDDPALMKEVFVEVWRRADIILCCGGLGPTFDDITREVWSDALHVPLRHHGFIVKDIRKKFKARGFEMPESNQTQAKVLRGARILGNTIGTAPGQFFKKGRKVLVLLPGPARELYPMMERLVLPKLRAIYTDFHSKLKTFLIVGVPESRIDEMIRPFVDARQTLLGCRITHGILAAQSIISVKFTVEGSTKKRVGEAVKQLTREMRNLIGHLTFGEDKDTLEGVIGRLLKKRQQTLAVAESCTGGLISKIITDQPGSSDYFVEGMVTYRNDSKRHRLKVTAATLKKFGAVSESAAREMAVGLRKSARVHYALSITGIAGPSGGTAKKPVGLVYIGCAGPRCVVVKEFRFKGERSWIRHRSALMALDILRRELLR